MKIFPTFMFDPFAAEPDLVLDRGVTLKVGAVSGVEYGDHGAPLREDRREIRLALRARSGDCLSLPPFLTARGLDPLPARIVCTTGWGWLADAPAAR